MTKSDANATRIVTALREAGATVRYIEGAFGVAGVPDILVGFRGCTTLMELKVKGGRLSPAQKEFHATWQGAPVFVVHNEVEALIALGLTP